MTGRRKKWDVLGLKQNTELKRNELPLQARLDEPGSPRPASPPSLPSSATPGGESPAPTQTRRCPLCLWYKERDHLSTGSPGPRPAGRPVPGAGPRTSSPIYGMRPRGAPHAHHPCSPSVLTAATFFLLHWERKKCPRGPGTQLPALLALLSPGGSQWTPPGHAAQSLSLSQEHGSSKRALSPPRNRSLRPERCGAPHLSKPSSGPGPQPLGAPHVPSFPGLACASRWEPLLSRSSMTSALPKPPDKSRSLYLTWQQEHWTELAPFRAPKLRGSPGGPPFPPRPPCSLRPRAPGSHPASGPLSVSRLISSPDLPLPQTLTLHGAGGQQLHKRNLPRTALRTSPPVPPVFPAS